MEYKKLPLDSKGELIKNEFGIRSPRNLVIVKYPKSGGTLSLCNSPKVLIADSERGTQYFKPDNSVNLLSYDGEEEFIESKKYGWIPAGIHQMVMELKEANNMEAFFSTQAKMEGCRDAKERQKLYDELIAILKAMPFPILAIDTITSITDVSNTAALFEYNKGVKTPKTNIKRVDDYSGVSYTRKKFAEIKNFIENNAAPFLQYHGHIGNKKKILKKGAEEISAVDIALEGLLSNIFTAHADAVCIFYRDENGCFLDFQKKEESDLGSRPLHLSNRVIKIADTLKEGELYPKNHWHEVYPDLW